MVSITPTLEQADIDEFARAGAICLRGLFSEEWLEKMRAAIKRRITAGPGAYSRHQKAFSFTELFMARSDPDFQSFVLDSPAAAIAAQLMRSKHVRFYFDQIFNKEAGLNEPSPWHNDQPFYPIAGSQVCSVWLALDHVTKESSGLQYVAGSHLWEDTPNGEFPDIDAIKDKCEILCWDMLPGDCLVHSGYTVHGATGNTTQDLRRRALATRWIGDDVMYRDLKKGREELQLEGLETGAPIPPTEMFPEVDWKTA